MFARDGDYVSDLGAVLYMLQWREAVAAVLWIQLLRRALACQCVGLGEFVGVGGAENHRYGFLSGGFFRGYYDLEPLLVFVLG